MNANKHKEPQFSLTPLQHHVLVVSSLLLSELGLQGTLLLHVGSLVLDVLGNGLLLSSTGDGGVGVQLVHHSLVAQRVRLLGVAPCFR